MAVFFSHLRGGVSALAGSALAVLANGVAQAQSMEAIEASVQAQVDAAQAAADAAISRANKQIAAAEARAKAISNSNAHTSGNSVRVVQSSGSGVNSINVVGNQAGKVVVECQGEPGAQVNVNSVVADGESLQGKTVIVTGRNSRDVQVRGNCKPVDGRNAQASGSGTGNVNSVIIR